MFVIEKEDKKIRKKCISFEKKNSLRNGEVSLGGPTSKL